MILLGFTNYFIMQWFFVRITRHTTIVVDEFAPTDISLMAYGEHSLGGKILKAHKEIFYSLQYWVYPLSGYGDKPYNYISGVKYRRITKVKRVKIDWVKSLFPVNPITTK